MKKRYIVPYCLVVFFTSTHMLPFSVAFGEDGQAEAQRTAFLDEDMSYRAGELEYKKFCLKNRPTLEQRAKIREHWFKYQENKIYLQKDLKLARLFYKKLMTDSTSSEREAKAAVMRIVESSDKLLAAKLELKTKIVFQVLSEEQRKCKFHQKLMKKSWGRSCGHSWDHNKSWVRDKSFAENASETELTVEATIADDSVEFGPLLSLEETAIEEEES